MPVYTELLPYSDELSKIFKNKEIFVKEKGKRKHIAGRLVGKPKGNAINDGYVAKDECLWRSLLVARFCGPYSSIEGVESRQLRLLFPIDYKSGVVMLLFSTPIFHNDLN
jgi:hypothetical protein